MRLVPSGWTAFRKPYGGARSGRTRMECLLPSPEPGMTVEIMGPNIPVTELAEKAGTISWEIFTGIGPRVPRHYTH